MVMEMKDILCRNAKIFIGCWEMAAKVLNNEHKVRFATFLQDANVKTKVKLIETP